MKTIVSTVLIACLLAISLHGFGTDEHVFKADTGDISVSESGNEKDTPDDTTSRLGAACDICQVVHQYVISEPDPALMAPLGLIRLTPSLPRPPGRMPDGLLRPPTI